MSKKRKFLIGFGLFILLLASLLKYFFFVYKKGEKVVVKGTVVKNEKPCCDAWLYFILKTGLRRIMVEYSDGGIAPTCKNPQSTEVGYSLEEGDIVEVYGVSDEGFNSVTICPSEEYYIRKLN